MPTKQTEKYNEPLPGSQGDVVPRMKRIRIRDLSSLVSARLEVEDELGRCANEESNKPFVFNAARKKALLAILDENDSPISAALRADAAAIAGGMRDKRFVPVVRVIALDETEDLETRLNAISSYINLAGQAACNDIETLLSSKAFLVRRTAYLSALRSKRPELVEIAAKRLKCERNKRIRNIVSRKIPSQQVHTTVRAR